MRDCSICNFVVYPSIEEYVKWRNSDKSDYRVIYLQIGREIVGMVEKTTYEEVGANE